MAKSVLKLIQPSHERPATPESLEPPEAELWEQLTGAYDLSEPAARALLKNAMASAERARKCREAISRDGEIVVDHHGDRRAHPLIGHESRARANFMAQMKMLRLDLPGT